MVDTRKMRSYIKLGDCAAGDRIIFKEEGELIEKEFDNQQQGGVVKKILWKTTASLDGQEPKEISLGENHISELKKAWGADTAKWVGREAIVAYETKQVWGERKKVPYLEPADGAIADAPPPQPSEPQEPRYDENGNEIAWDE